MHYWKNDANSIYFNGTLQFPIVWWNRLYPPEASLFSWMNLEHSTQYEGSGSVDGESRTSAGLVIHYSDNVCYRTR